MSDVANILDASAVLAYLQDEKGAQTVEAALDEGPCWITAVNACEVLGKLCDIAMPPQEAQAALDDLGLVIKNFDSELALLAASLRVRTKPIGASLGDRACLALAQHATQAGAAAAVYTAEQAWATLEWPFKVVVIR